MAFFGKGMAFHNLKFVHNRIIHNNIFPRRLRATSINNLHEFSALCVRDISVCRNGCLGGRTTLSEGKTFQTLSNGFWNTQHKQKRSCSNGQPHQRLKLMDFDEIMYPNNIKCIENLIFKFMLKSFDSNFTTAEFLEGVKQAVMTVSSLLSMGKFDALEGLVQREVINQVQGYYERLTPEQQQFIAVAEGDLQHLFIYEIDVIFDDETQRRFVEITVVLYGLNGAEYNMASEEQFEENTYMCNYRFIREYTKGVEDDWTISALNHFKPMELTTADH